MTQHPQLLDIEQARELLSEFGLELNLRQMQRAAEPNAQGQRKLPFFKCPIEGRLRIEKNAGSSPSACIRSPTLPVV